MGESGWVTTEGNIVLWHLEQLLAALHVHVELRNRKKRRKKEEYNGKIRLKIKGKLLPNIVFFYSINKYTICM